MPFVALESSNFGINLLLNLPTSQENLTKGAAWEVKIGPRGYPPEVQKNRSQKNASPRESQATGSEMGANI